MQFVRHQMRIAGFGKGQELTAGRQRAIFTSAPKANKPVLLQSATEVCLLAPADRYSTDSPSAAMSTGVYERAFEVSLKIVSVERSDWLRRLEWTLWRSKVLIDKHRFRTNKFLHMQP